MFKTWRELLNLDPNAGPAGPAGAYDQGGDPGGGFEDPSGGEPGGLETPDGASILDEGQPDYGGFEDPAGAHAAPAAPAQGGQPAGDGLPDNHWARDLGLSTQTELRQYAIAARQHQTENQTLRGLLERIQRANSMAGQPAAAPAQPGAPAKKPFDWYGYGTPKAWADAYAVNPEEAERRRYEYAQKNWAQKGPDINQALDQRLAPIEEQAAAQRLRSQYDQLVAEEPSAREGTPQWKATSVWLQGNPWHAAMALARPRVTAELAAQFPEIAQYIQTVDQAFGNANLPRIAWQAAQYELIKAAKAAGDKRAQLTRGAAGAARPGAAPARTTVPQGNDVEAMLQQDIDEASRAGFQLDEQTLSALRHSYERL